MSTAYYLYNIPDPNKLPPWEPQAKQLLGVRTFEKKKRCFTWQMNPGTCMYELALYAPFRAVIDEYGNKQLIYGWLAELTNIDIMRYNHDEPLELEGQAEASGPGPAISPLALPRYEKPQRASGPETDWQRAGPGGDLAKGGCADAPGAGKGSGRGGPAVTTQEAIAFCQEIEASTLDLLGRVHTHLAWPEEDYRNKSDSVERCLEMVGGQLMEAWSHAGRAINRLMKLRDQEIGQELAQLHGHAEEGNKTRQAD